jgi:hypothetical protein
MGFILRTPGLNHGLEARIRGMVQRHCDQWRSEEDGARPSGPTCHWVHVNRREPQREWETGQWATGVSAAVFGLLARGEWGSRPHKGTKMGRGPRIGPKHHFLSFFFLLILFSVFLYS